MTQLDSEGKYDGKSEAEDKVIESFIELKNFELENKNISRVYSDTYLPFVKLVQQLKKKSL